MRKRILIFVFIILISMFLFVINGNIACAQAGLKSYIESVEQAKEGMTLWQLIKSGGFIMVILTILSMAAFALVIYDFIILKVKKLSPRDFTEAVIEKLEEGKEKAVRSMCQFERHIISNIVMAGLEKKDKGAVFAREAMENCARKEIGNLWQNISYLADIAVVSPLLGLLGTVLGMIQAFNVIAFQTAVVKPILIAGGVSKAMVTTAAGLIVAIPTMIFYAYFRGKVQEISNTVESYTGDIIRIISK